MQLSPSENTRKRQSRWSRGRSLISIMIGTDRSLTMTHIFIVYTAFTIYRQAKCHVYVGLISTSATMTNNIFSFLKHTIVYIYNSWHLQIRYCDDRKNDLKLTFDIIHKILLYFLEKHLPLFPFPAFGNRRYINFAIVTKKNITFILTFSRVLGLGSQPSLCGSPHYHKTFSAEDCVGERPLHWPCVDICVSDHWIPVRGDLEHTLRTTSWCYH